MKKLVLLGAALLMAACARSATDPAAARKSPASARADDEINCKGGYVIAYDEDGNAYCAPIPGFVGGDSAQISSRATPMTASPRR